jgi:hypothetical protein
MPTVVGRLPAHLRLSVMGRTVPTRGHEMSDWKDDEDWDEVFKYAKPEPIIGVKIDTAPFTMDDVATVTAKSDGENDADDHRYADKLAIDVVAKDEAAQAGRLLAESRKFWRDIDTTLDAAFARPPSRERTDAASRDEDIGMPEAKAPP